MNKIKINIVLILYLLIIGILTFVMFYNINRKEGFHEDEIFSYGASNSSLGSTFISYRRVDNLDTIMKTDNPFITIKNFFYYRFFNNDEYSQKERELINNTDTAIWRTREDANEYMKIDNGKEALDFFTLYWNTAKDVHPPLFYIMVHLCSTLFFNHFTKYIIFLVNLVFFLLTCFILYKVFTKLEKKYLSIPNIILYGASIGAISTVMFQRMYMMLTFFSVYFLYINLKIYFNNFVLNKKNKIELCIVTVLGFLTQYYFCIYAACVVFVMLCLMLKKKDNCKKEIVTYFLQFVKAGVVGVILFLPSIYHIFFSYRGGGSSGSEYNFLENFYVFTKNVLLAFSLKNIIGVIIVFIITIVWIFKFIKSEKKDLYLIFTIPIIIDFVLIIKLSPYRSLRYVMNILPIISMIVILLIDDMVKHYKICTIVTSVCVILLSVYGLANNPVKFMYIGYNNYLEIAREYSEDRFILICPPVFNHIQDAPEYQIYRESMILDPKNIDFLKKVKELKDENEFILSIKNWIEEDRKEILNKVLEYTGYSNYEMLYDSGKSANCVVYRISR